MNVCKESRDLSFLLTVLKLFSGYTLQIKFLKHVGMFKINGKEQTETDYKFLWHFKPSYPKFPNLHFFLHLDINYRKGSS